MADALDMYGWRTRVDAELRTTWQISWNAGLPVNPNPFLTSEADFVVLGRIQDPAVAAALIVLHRIMLQLP